MSSDLEIIVRGVMVKRGMLLVCHNKKKTNVFLPGGHIEFNESAREALRRELKEEMGVKARVTKFLGACEHSFRWKGERICEINLVFEYNISGVNPPKPAPSQEKNLEFIWIPLAKLRSSRLEPHSLKRDLARWLDAKSRPTSGFSSTY